MAELLGEFSLKHVCNVYGKTPEGEIANYVNWEGTATGFGAVYGTLSTRNPLSEMGARSGKCTWVGQAFLDDGVTTLGGMGEGTWEHAEGEHKWKVEMDVEISNGDKHHSVGEIDLATLTFMGKIYAV